MSTASKKASRIAPKTGPTPPARPVAAKLAKPDGKLPKAEAKPARADDKAARLETQKEDSMKINVKRSPEAGEEASPENLDKVRDILFGSQVREQQKRFQRIEDRLAKDVADLRDELLKRLSSLENYVKGEVDTIMDKLKEEHTARTTAVREINGEISDNHKAAEKRAGELDTKMTDAVRELRKSVLEQSKSLRDEISSANQASTAAAEKGISTLRNDKTDRLALADLLTEVAMKLKGEMKMPKGS